MNTGQKTLESMSQAMWYNKFTLSLFSKYLSGEILEIGCGIGNFTKDLSGYGRVTAIDIEKEYIKKTKNSLKSRVSVGLGNIEKGEYFFKNKKFNSVVCLNVLEHIENDDRALENIYKLLNKDGYLILQVPGHKFLYGSIDKSIGHYRRYNLSDLKKKLEGKGFKIVESKKFNLLGSIGWFISGKLLNKVVVEEGKIKIFNKIAPLILPLERIIEPPIGISALVIAQK